MTWRGSILGLALTAAVLAFAAADRPSSRPARNAGASWDNYRVLVTRNMFLRDRSRPLTSRPTSVRTNSRGDEGALTLTGIGQQQSQPVAFLEDTRTGRTARLTAGETVNRGRILSVTLDGIDYERGGVRRRILIGQSIAGEAAFPTVSAPATQPATTQSAASAPGASGDASVESILERLRRRRAQE